MNMLLKHALNVVLIEAEKSLPEVVILPFGSGGAHDTFPKTLIGKTIKYYVQ
jgi:hypothetical protein